MTESHPAPPSANPPKPASGPLRPVIFIMVVFFAVFAVVAASKWFAPPERVAWRTDLPAALAEANAAGKPVLLYVTADWCGPCQWMRRQIFTDADVARAIDAAYVPVRIDHDQRLDLVQRYQVEAIPWFGILDEQGRPVRILNRGLETPQEMITWLER